MEVVQIDKIRINIHLLRSRFALLKVMMRLPLNHHLLPPFLHYFIRYSGRRPIARNSEITQYTASKMDGPIYFARHFA